jgi:hypothetical protein
MPTSSPLPAHHKGFRILSGAAWPVNPERAQRPGQIVRPMIQAHDVGADPRQLTERFPDGLSVRPPEAWHCVATQIAPAVRLQVGRVQEDQIGRLHQIQNGTCQAPVAL